MMILSITRTVYLCPLCVLESVRAVNQILSIKPEPRYIFSVAGFLSALLDLLNLQELNDGCEDLDARTLGF